MKKTYAWIMIWIMTAWTHAGDWLGELWYNVSEWFLSTAGKADAAIVRYEGKWNEALEASKRKLAGKMAKTGLKVRREMQIDGILRDKAKAAYEAALVRIDAEGVARRKKLYAKNDRYAAKYCAAELNKKG